MRSITSIRVLDMSRIGSVLTGDRSELRDGPQVHAMLIQNQNPLTVCPDSNRVRRGFARDDLFVCVHEQFMTETARWADIVLPATMFMEHDDLYQAGGHTHIQIGPKLIEPPGECRSNHEVLQGLAARLGAKHRGFEMTAMEIIDATLRAVRLAGRGDGAARALDRCARCRSSRRISSPAFRSRTSGSISRRTGRRWGRTMRACRACRTTWPSIDATTPEHPFRLVTAPARSFLNTSFTEMPSSRRREGRPTVLMHPRRCGAAGYRRRRPGAARQCARRGGAARAHCRRAAAGRAGAPKASGRANAFEGGIGINALTSDDPGPPDGGAVFHDTAVWLRAEVMELALAAQ